MPSCSTGTKTSRRAGWNIFALRGGMLMSPDSGVLEGITRQTVVELSAKLNIDCRLTNMPAKTLREADEVFITSTAGGIMPVRTIDGRPIGEGPRARSPCG